MTLGAYQLRILADGLQEIPGPDYVGSCKER